MVALARTSTQVLMQQHGCMRRIGAAGFWCAALSLHCNAAVAAPPPLPHTHACMHGCAWCCRFRRRRGRRCRAGSPPPWQWQRRPWPWSAGAQLPAAEQAAPVALRGARDKCAAHSSEPTANATSWSKRSRWPLVSTRWKSGAHRCASPHLCYDGTCMQVDTPKMQQIGGWGELAPAVHSCRQLYASMCVCVAAC